jgi:hypothetical protein
MSESGEGQPGRPEIKFSKQQREQIAQLASINTSQEAIALLVGTTVDTLRRKCMFELELGKWVWRGKSALKLFELAHEKGNVAALRELLAMQRAAAATDTLKGDTPTAPAAETRQERLGKKELADQAAQTAGRGTEWGSDLDPAVPN